jgi:aspartyl-tRNA(Asn)/glutamyl-tRNA(Gln) amidotransferase subunit A
MPSAERPAADVPTELGAAEAARAIRRGRLSPVELVRACLERIRARDGALRAWVHVDEPGALAAAREREAEVRAGRVRGPLHGVPLAVKDIIDVAGWLTTAGARPWAHRRAERDATCVARLRAAGAIVLGKTATTEFAYRDPAPTRNPWNPGHTPGGSSAGSAVAVAARMVPLALGSQTVGSVLRPAAYCGVVGFKPAYGLVPLEGVLPLAWSLDHVGVFARHVDDAAVAFGVLTGQELELVPVERPRLALPPEVLAEVASDVAAHLKEVAACLGAAGADVEEVKLPPSYGSVREAGRVVLEAEAAAYHEPMYRAHAAEYGREIRALVEAGLARSATAYVRAQRARRAFRDELGELLRAYDALLVPTAPAPAPAGLASTGDASCCAPWTYAGVPAITLPSGLAPSGLPYGVQLVQDAAGSARLLAVARWCERVLQFQAGPPA